MKTHFPALPLRFIDRLLYCAPANVAPIGFKIFLPQYRAARGHIARLPSYLVHARERIITAHLDAERAIKADPDRWVTIVDDCPYTTATPWLERRVRVPGSVLWDEDNNPTRRLWTLVAWAHVPYPWPLLRWARAQLEPGSSALSAQMYARVNR